MLPISLSILHERESFSLWPITFEILTNKGMLLRVPIIKDGNQCDNNTASGELVFECMDWLRHYRFFLSQSQHMLEVLELPFASTSVRLSHLKNLTSIVTCSIMCGQARSETFKEWVDPLEYVLLPCGCKPMQSVTIIDKLCITLYCSLTFYQRFLIISILYEPYIYLFLLWLWYSHCCTN